MNTTYEAWAMMNSDNDVVSEEYNTPEEAINEMKERGYTVEEMHEAGLTCNKLLCDESCWFECLDEFEY